MTKGTQKLSYPSGATKYYTNCRGVNYVPIMYSQWEKSGYLPRYNYDFLLAICASIPELAGLAGVKAEQFSFDGSACFFGANKTSQWWYYDSDDNDKSLKLLRDCGINSIRVFLDIYVWGKKGQQFIEDLKDFMKLCDKHKMRVQLVIWDGIYIPDGSNLTEPGSTQGEATANQVDTLHNVYGTGRSCTLYRDPVEYGLYQVWLRQPFGYQISSTEAAQNFYATSAQPYLTQICNAVSSFQSFWSFDLANESDYEKEPYKFDVVMTSSSYLISSLLSSIDVGITFGNGDSFRYYLDPMVGGINNGQLFYDVYPFIGENRRSALLDFSSLYNFASIHPYGANTRMGFHRYVDEAVSASKMLGKPSMYNEISYPPYRAAIKYVHKDKKYGGMVWDGLIDFGLTHEPFSDYGGLFHPDGEARCKEDIEAYHDITLSDGWLKKSQLKLSIKEKKLSSDNGIDGGYASSVIPFHKNYDPNIHVSTTLDKWSFIAAAVYNSPELNSIGAALSGVVNKWKSSKNYVPIYDEQPFSLLLTDNDSKKYEIKDFIYDCRNHKTKFRDFSSILSEDYGIQKNDNPTPSGLSAGPIYQRLNLEASKKITIIDRVSKFTLNVWRPLPQAHMIGSQYDYLPASGLRLAASSHLYAWMRGLNVSQNFGDGSSIIAWDDNKLITNVSSTGSWASGTGYYMIPGNKYSGVDWWGYDEWFETAFDYINQYLDVLEEAAKTNDFYRLY